MAELPTKKGPRKRAIMLGLGLDSDGHKRLTVGSNFLLAGGTQETHELMTEKVIKLNEQIQARGKTLEGLSHNELDEIAQSVGLRQCQSPKELESGESGEDKQR